MKTFNIYGSCNPKIHYMVDITDRLEKIKQMIDSGAYMTINRGRQYGKTTTIKALKKYLSYDYLVISLDFQALDEINFDNSTNFVKSFIKLVLDFYEDKIAEEICENFRILADNENISLRQLFAVILKWCETASKLVVLIIDEVDSASNNHLFLDFLAQLRFYYLNSDEYATFQSVILAGVHDIRNIRQKIRPDSEHKHNSPWNIATSFDVDMSFSPEDISTMLRDYENDKHKNIDIPYISQSIYDYTSGYPVLVSNICKIIDEKGLNWNKDGIETAVGEILLTKNYLFDSLMGKLEDIPELKEKIYSILVVGNSISYNPDDPIIDLAMMYGFVKVVGGKVRIANRIFETRIYDALLTTGNSQSTPMFVAGERNKPEFIVNGRLDMELILTKFGEYYTDIYGGSDEKFIEEEARKLFLLFIRPIINSVGHYYIEAQTRDYKRTDVIIDYNGEQFIIELKIWHGDEYNKKGEQQLLEYLEYYHLNSGYLVSFNFNKNKMLSTKNIEIQGKKIFEVTV